MHVHYAHAPKIVQDLGLDPRLLRSLAKKGFNKPTPVQLEAIPKTLEGKDIVARFVCARFLCVCDRRAANSMPLDMPI
jgi:hypothetical protein